MNPYVSWAITLAVVGGLGYYYSNTSKSKNKTPVRTVPEKTEPAFQAPKPKKQKPRKQSDSSAPKKSDERKVAPSSQVGTAVEVEEDIDNQEFARRLAAARSGVSVGDSKTKGPKEKGSKSLPLTQENVRSNSSTRAPSSNGADADDDSSSTDWVSPSSRDVSDMLEKPAPGPSVIRITGSSSTTEKKAKPQAFKQVETKKQRQNRQKNEARKQANQEAEAERRQLLEKQLHTAREAERREASRKGAATSVPSSNAWTSTNRNSAAVSPSTTTAAPAALPLLDTFEPSEPASASGSSSGAWSKNLPTEDEQMRILGVASSTTDEDWTTVSSKKEKTKKKSKGDESFTELSASETATSNEPEATPQPNDWPTPKVTQVPIPRGKNHPLDSDWAA